MAERKLGVGIIGCGGIGSRVHAPNYARNPRVRLAAVADVDVDRARALAERWDVPAYYQDYRELLANPDVEAVSVTTPVFMHAAPAIAAMEAGKHVLCEKPIARTLAEADAMVETARRCGVLLTMGYQPRFSRLWERAKQVVDSGLLGRIVGVNTVSYGRAGLPAPWFLDPAKAGGGIFMDWGIYTAYMLQWLAGPIAAVSATTRAFRTEYPAGGQLIKDVQVEDTGVATLEFASGALGVWYQTWAGVTGHGYTSIDGLEGALVMRPGHGDGPLLYSVKPDEPEFLRGWRTLAFQELPLAEQHYRKLDHLVTAALDGTPLVMTGADGRDALEVIQAIYQSAEMGQRVRLPLPREQGR
jgi:predicted dehydrogenase